jgi:lactobin A/cerein 7B family class IIb bacteriocin
MIQEINMVSIAQNHNIVSLDLNEIDEVNGGMFPSVAVTAAAAAVVGVWVAAFSAGYALGKDLAS